MERSLPYKINDYYYKSFKVIDNVQIKCGIAAPAFGRPGGAIQLQILNPNNLNKTISVQRAIELKLIVPIQ